MNEWNIRATNRSGVLTIIILQFDNNNPPISISTITNGDHLVIVVHALNE